jgi:signal transduction histidine kinase
LQGLILSLRLLDIRGHLGRDRGAKSRFPASVSHELPTPRKGIYGLAEFLARDCDTAERRRMATAIQASSQTLMG